MFFDSKIPLPGDVLFYTKKKPHAKAIEAKQRSLGFFRSELIHAAIMVDNRVLTQATVGKGVDYVPIYLTRETFTENIPPVVLRHHNLAGRGSAIEDLWNASFYFYKQKYDWVGALQRHRADETRKICSTLVQMILSRLDEFSGIGVVQGDFQIYPAELFAVLMEAGFQEIGPYDQPNNRSFGRTHDLQMLHILEQNRQIEKRGADIEHWAFLGIGIRELQIFMLQSSSSVEQLVRLLSYSIPHDGSLLTRAQYQLDTLNDNLKTYSDRIVSTPMSWRDKSDARENVAELRKKLDYEIDIVGRDIAALTDFVDTGINQYLSVCFKEREYQKKDFEAVFTIRFLDAGSQITDTPEKIITLVRSVTELDERIAAAGFYLEEEKIKRQVFRLLEIVTLANKRNIEILKSMPEVFSRYLLEVDSLVSTLRELVKKEILKSQAENSIER